MPACCCLKGQRSYFANVIFVVNDENSSHERIYSLMGSELAELACWLPACGFWVLSGGAGGGEIGEFGAEAVDHGEDEFFDLLGLNLGLGEDLGGAETELGHFGF